VYANELSVQGAHLDSTHAYFNGACLFMYPDGQKDDECEIRVSPPRGWAIVTGLEPTGRGSFRARDFDELIDCPVEIGTHRLLKFRVKGDRPVNRSNSICFATREATAAS